MGDTSLRARFARWIGGKALNAAEKAAPKGDATEEGLPDRDALPLLERIRIVEAEMLDLSVQWSDLNDAVRKWSARLASQKAAETRKALAAITNGHGDAEEPADGQPEPPADAEAAALATRAAKKAELARIWNSRRR